MDVNQLQIPDPWPTRTISHGLWALPLELIQQLDSSIAHSTDERRSAMLRHLTDLFLVGSDQYSDDEIDLIDDFFYAACDHNRGIIARAAGHPAWRY
jgi:hypothetical protein